MVQIVAMMKFLVNYGVELSSFLGLTAMMIPFIISIILPFVAQCVCLAVGLLDHKAVLFPVF